VGRSREMREIERLLDRAATGAGGVLVITGPAGSGRSALLDAAAESAGRRSFQVLRARAAAPFGRLVWAQLLRDAGAPDAVAERLLAGPDPLDLDDAARSLAGSEPRLILIDDLDDGGPGALEPLAVLAARAATTPTLLVACADSAVGVGGEPRLALFTRDEMAELLGPMTDELVHAIWVASRGRPGAAITLAADLVADQGRGFPDPGPLKSSTRTVSDPIVRVALHTMSVAEFLEVDDAVITLLESAAVRAGDEGTRARVLARLARELLGDASAGPRRRELVDEALGLARHCGDPGILAEVLDAGLHARWDPDAATERLTGATEIVELARAGADPVRERQGLFWRFVALMELGRVAEAESALAAFERAAADAGDRPGLVMARARHAMLAILHGRYGEADRLIAEVAELGDRIGLPDTQRLALTLRAAIATERVADQPILERGVSILLAVARRQPGHYFEATAARIMLRLGRTDEAAAELTRVLSRVLAGSGPRWIAALADLAPVAAAVEDRPAAQRIYDALLPYHGRLVIFGGANMTLGPVDYYLGVLAECLDRPEAIAHLETAVAQSEEIGALPSLAHGLVALADARPSGHDTGPLPARAREIAERLGMTVLLDRLAHPVEEWLLERDGDDWLLAAGPERARLRDSRGLHYLRALLRAPRSEIRALDLVADGTGLVVSDTGPLLDAPAVASYRARLAELDADLDAADRAGDTGKADQTERERQALLGELRRSTGLQGRPRLNSAEAERARVNVTRTLRTAIDRVEAAAPRVGAHLRASIRTGHACRYDPAPDGPPRWHT
jgi:tetratricopeptide (TPR) repeat protein